MKDYISVLRSVELFSGLDPGELDSVLGCIGAVAKTVRKGSAILHAGDKPEQIGVVLRGQMRIVRDDYEGNRSLVAILSPGDIFAEALCCADVDESPVTVLADVDSRVLLLPFGRMLQVCSNSCSFHRELIKNILRLTAEKNLRMQKHMEILSMKTIRARVVRYIESFSLKPGCEIVVPLNREELANYLCVERSALSHELMKMKADGLIDYNKNRFILK